MQVTEIKKDDEGIEKVLDGYRGQRVEETRLLRSAEPEFGEIRQKYEQYLACEEVAYYGIISNIKKTLTDTTPLPPEEINRFFALTVGYDNHPSNILVGYFITALIQRSYDKGYNDFAIDTKGRLNFTRAEPEGSHISGIGVELSGTEDRKLRMRVSGGVTHCGGHAKHAVISIYDDPGKFTGCAAVDSEFYIDGEAKQYTGSDAERCTFRTPNGKTSSVLREFVPRVLRNPETNEVVNTNNRIIFIQEDGREINIDARIYTDRSWSMP